MVCIFAKAPRAGEVKTRLAHAVGADRAAQLAAAMLQDTIGEVTRAGLPTVLATTEPKALQAYGLEVWDQGGGDLGQRLERVIRRATALTGYALCIGADSPALTALELLEAQRALGDHDAVLAPAEDGGFVLLGLKHCPAGLLSEILWSHASTGTAVRGRLEQRGYRVTTLPQGWDIDHVEDLERLGGLPPQVAPNSRALVGSWAGMDKPPLA